MYYFIKAYAKLKFVYNIDWLYVGIQFQKIAMFLKLLITQKHLQRPNSKLKTFLKLSISTKKLNDVDKCIFAARTV